MNILPINNCESITTASTRTGKQQLRFAISGISGDSILILIDCDFATPV
jgi:hypothetical protein